MMPNLAAAAQTILDQLAAAGIRATQDYANLNPPGVLLKAPKLGGRFKGGTYAASWSAYLVAPDSTADAANQILGTLIDEVEAALVVGPIEWDPADFPTTEGALLPAYLATWSDRIT